MAQQFEHKSMQRADFKNVDILTRCAGFINFDHTSKFMPLPIHSNMFSAAISQDFSISAVDGYPLAARLWTPTKPSVASNVALVNAGAGIASPYYDRFAAYLADAGCPTVVYDYRGIGRSRPPSLRGFRASVEQWGSKDCAGVLEWLTNRFPGARRMVVGHSVGGFLTGFAQNGHLIDRMLLVSAHTGFWGDYAPRARSSMYLLWHILMPTLSSAFGYFPGRRLHLMEDLPAGVAAEWAARRKPDFWWNLRNGDGSPDQQLIDTLIARFHNVRAKALALRVVDDAFATEAATDRILGLFANCQARRIAVTRADVGGQKIGHFGFFRARFRQTLWPIVVEWLRQCH